VTTGEQVRALVRQSAPVDWLDALGVEILRGDIGDAGAVERAADKCRIVFHLAAKTESAGLLSRQDVYVANVRGTENVTRAALRAGVERLVFCSSVAVYGRIAKNRMIDEKTETDPDSPYGESKVRGEQVVLSASTARWFSSRRGSYFDGLGPGNDELVGPVSKYCIRTVSCDRQRNQLSSYCPMSPMSSKDCFVAAL
jgi:nucleoside-diphosphate-sugar epimerase